MKVLHPDVTLARKASARPPKEILAELDDVFASGWQDQQQKIADLMGGLQHNGALLRDWVAKALERDELPELTGAQSFIIHRSPNMVARLNLWFAPGESDRTISEYRRYLSIDELHNHNFEFFTILLLGSGYTTDYYRDDNWAPGMCEGGHLELGDASPFKLSGNSVHLVDRLYDYHSVSWPDTFSVSLNVMPNCAPQEEQYIVDAQTRSIKFVIAPNSVEQVE